MPLWYPLKYLLRTWPSCFLWVSWHPLINKLLCSKVTRFFRISYATYWAVFSSVKFSMLTRGEVGMLSFYTSV